MAFRTSCVALLLLSLPVAGCGTVANLARQGPESGGVSPFGGVRQDVWCLQKAANGEIGCGAHPKADSQQYPRVALMLFCAADLPLSFIGDVVTWPYTVSYTYINQPIPVPPILQAAAPPPVTPLPLPVPPDVPPMPVPLPPMAPAAVRAERDAGAVPPVPVPSPPGVDATTASQPKASP
jgi:hypothetical protein